MTDHELDAVGGVWAAHAPQLHLPRPPVEDTLPLTRNDRALKPLRIIMAKRAQMHQRTSHESAHALSSRLCA
jgi:hypothetical protein